MTEYQVGDKITFAGNWWTVLKTAPGRLLLKGYGYKKWFSIEEIEENKKVVSGFLKKKPKNFDSIA